MNERVVGREQQAVPWSMSIYDFLLVRVRAMLDHGADFAEGDVEIPLPDGRIATIVIAVHVKDVRSPALNS